MRPTSYDDSAAISFRVKISEIEFISIPLEGPKSPQARETRNGAVSQQLFFNCQKFLISNSLP
jgi:hypothetical protein